MTTINQAVQPVTLSEDVREMKSRIVPSIALNQDITMPPGTYSVQSDANLVVGTETQELGAITVTEIGADGLTSIVISAPANTVFEGTVLIGGNAAAVSSFPAEGANTITLNGTTTGGAQQGDKITFKNVATGVIAVDGFTLGSGTLATPFSTV